MAIIKIGERGQQVVQLQRALNERPSKLAVLATDGVFGVKTQARVVEFQRDNGLKADGLVGDITQAALRQQVRPAPAPDIPLLVSQLTAQLAPLQRASFVSGVQPFVGPRVLANPAVLAGPAIEALMLLIILLLMATILINSQNKANQEAGRALKRKIDNLRDRLLDDPADGAAVAAEALQAAKDNAQKLVDRAQAEREKCFERMTPQQRADKLRDCAKKVEAVTTAIKSLLEKIRAPIGRFKPDDLIKGINFSAQALMEALRALGTCTGCDGLFF